MANTYNQWNGHLSANANFSSIYNMVMDQIVLADNIKGTLSTLVDRYKTEGSMYGDTLLFYANDVLGTEPWGGYAEATNLLQTRKPADPACQAIKLDIKRMVWITVDKYLTKQAWMGEGKFNEFQSVILGMLPLAKELYDSTTFNVFVGTTETTKNNQVQTVTLPLVADNIEAQNRLQAQVLAQKMADLIFVDLQKPHRNLSDYGYMRSYDYNDIDVIWNSAWYNRILKKDLPTMFHKDDLMVKWSDEQLPPEYFGTVKTTPGSAAADNETTGKIRTLIEKDYAGKHLFAGEVIPNSTAYLANEAYEVDPTIVCKVVHRNGLKYMSGFTTGTDFNNPRSLTENHYLIFMRSKPTYLYNYPMITIKAVEATPAPAPQA